MQKLTLPKIEHIFQIFKMKSVSRLRRSLQIAEEVKALKEDFIKTVKSQFNALEEQRKTGLQELDAEASEKPLYAARASETSLIRDGPPSVPHNQSVLHNQSVPHNQTTRTKRVDPQMSVIIKNVISSKYRNSSHCKSQFNKHFHCMRIKSIFSTQAGNIIVELYEKEDIQRVLHEWKPYFFGLNNNSGIYNKCHLYGKISC